MTNEDVIFTRQSGEKMTNKDKILLFEKLHTEQNLNIEIFYKVL